MSAAESLEYFEEPLLPGELQLLPDQSDKFNLFHGSIEVGGTREPVPYSMAVPETLQSQALVIIVPGFGAFKQTSRGLRNALAEQGVITVSYDPARLDESFLQSVKNFNNPQELHYKTIEAIVKDLAECEEDLPAEHLDIIRNSNITLVGNSMGGLPTAEFAAENDEIIDQVIYLGSIGLQDPLGLKVIPRTVKELFTDIIPGVARGDFGYSPATAYRSIRYFARNPVRTVAEIISCAKADIRPQALSLRNGPVQQFIITLGKDKYFIPAEVEIGGAWIADGYSVMDGEDHTAPQKKAQKVARFIGTILVR